jgi:hypothetical protein
MRPLGCTTIEKIVDDTGKVVPLEKAIHYGWIKFDSRESYLQHQSGGIKNVYTDNGRQLLAFCFAFRSPIENYVCRRFGVGTGLTAAKTTDVALQAPVPLASNLLTGPIDSIDFLSAFVVRVAFTLGNSDANGYAITEQGLFSGNDTLIARRVRGVAINKSSFAVSLLHRLRFAIPFVLSMLHCFT